MQTVKAIMTLWVVWKKSVKLAVTIDHEDFDGSHI